ncbi:MAG: hypothetical protein ABSC19_04505 [Syntrophorhabdales bacterium]|jgi:hypothetical protein
MSPKAGRGLIQGLVTWVSHGYCFVCKTHYPDHKDQNTIDEKLIRKYRADLEKTKRWRVRKETGAAMFALIRLRSTAFLLHTDGGLPSVYDDRFIDLRSEPLKVRVSASLVFEISVKNRKTEVCLSGRTYEWMKAGLADAVQTRSKTRILARFERLNGLPAYHGIVDQKVAIATWLLHEAHGAVAYG